MILKTICILVFICIPSIANSQHRVTVYAVNTANNPINKV